jgi:hypothetical protein
MVGETVELLVRHMAGDDMTPYERLLGGRSGAGKRDAGP